MTNAKRTYEILDPEMRFVGAHRIRKGQTTIEVTPDEAKFFVENGGLREQVQGDEKPKAKATSAKAD